jgi:hypothetical protein
VKLAAFTSISSVKLDQACGQLPALWNHIDRAACSQQCNSCRVHCKTWACKNSGHCKRKRLQQFAQDKTAWWWLPQVPPRPVDKMPSFVSLLKHCISAHMGRPMGDDVMNLNNLFRKACKLTVQQQLLKSSRSPARLDCHKWLCRRRQVDDLPAASGGHTVCLPCRLTFDCVGQGSGADPISCQLQRRACRRCATAGVEHCLHSPCALVQHDADCANSEPALQAEDP